MPLNNSFFMICMPLISKMRWSDLNIKHVKWGKNNKHRKSEKRNTVLYLQCYKL